MGECIMKKLNKGYKKLVSLAAVCSLLLAGGIVTGSAWGEDEGSSSQECFKTTATSPTPGIPNDLGYPSDVTDKPVEIDGKLVSFQESLKQASPEYNLLGAILNNYQMFVSGDYNGYHVNGAVAVGGTWNSANTISAPIPHTVPSYIGGPVQQTQPGDTHTGLNHFDEKTQPLILGHPDTVIPSEGWNNAVKSDEPWIDFAPYMQNIQSQGEALYAHPDATVQDAVDVEIYKIHTETGYFDGQNQTIKVPYIIHAKNGTKITYGDGSSYTIHFLYNDQLQAGEAEKKSVKVGYRLEYVDALGNSITEEVYTAGRQSFYEYEENGEQKIRELWDYNAEFIRTTVNNGEMQEVPGDKNNFVSQIPQNAIYWSIDSNGDKYELYSDAGKILLFKGASFLTHGRKVHIETHGEDVSLLPDTIIASNSTEDVYIPDVIFMNDGQPFTPNTAEGKEDGIGLLFDFPKAKGYVFEPTDLLFGHIVAPYATVDLGNGNGNGSVIAKDVIPYIAHYGDLDGKFIGFERDESGEIKRPSGRELHMWSYRGTSLKIEKPTGVRIQATKTLLNSTLKDGQFSFMLEGASEQDGVYTVAQGVEACSVTATNIGGTITFAGEYDSTVIGNVVAAGKSDEIVKYYILSESVDETNTSIKYDDTRYLVKVTISKTVSADGNTTTYEVVGEPEYSKLDKDGRIIENSVPATFTNTYLLRKGSIKIPAKKIVKNGTDDNARYTFNIVEVTQDGGVIEGGQSQTVTVGEGVFEFPELTFEDTENQSAQGTHYFKITEEVADDDPFTSSLSADGMILEVQVNPDVKDAHKYIVTSAYSSENPFEVTNTYFEKSKGKLQFAVEKKTINVDNSEVSDTSTLFTFNYQLMNTQGQGVLVGDPISQTMQGAGHLTFDEIVIDEDFIGSHLDYCSAEQVNRYRNEEYRQVTMTCTYKIWESALSNDSDYVQAIGGDAGSENSQVITVRIEYISNQTPQVTITNGTNNTSEYLEFNNVDGDSSSAIITLKATNKKKHSSITLPSAGGGGIPLWITPLGVVLVMGGFLIAYKRREVVE